MTDTNSRLEEPNVLMILADQLNSDVLSCYGGPVQTPNIDRLARNGAQFTGAVCPTASCAPSRASVFTGQFPHSHGIAHNVNRREYPDTRSPPTEEGIKSSDVTLGSLYHKLGYSTHHYGKWHLMDEDLPYFPDMYREHHRYAQEMAERFRAVKTRPREEWVDWYGWALPVEVDKEYREVVEGAPFDWQGSRESLQKMGRLLFDVEETFDYRVADHAVARLEKVKEPFFLTASFNIPHDPNLVPSPYFDQFDPADISLPDNSDVFEDRFAEDWSRRYVRAVGERGVREFLRVYYGMVAFLDDLIGRLLETLDDRGVTDRTVVAFAADHGDLAGGHGMIWKGTSAFYDEIFQVPFLVNGPDVVPGKRNNAASHTDLLPTLLDLTGHSDAVPPHIDGHSLGPMLRDPADESARPQYALMEQITANPEHTRRDLPGNDDFAIRGNGWKYVSYDDGQELLYDLDADPGEKSNLSGDSNYDTIRTELASYLQARLKETGYRTSR